MRLAFAASALCLNVLALSLTQLAQAAAPQAATAAAAPVASDAAARHVKRTACLKEARAKKLIGAEKTAFLKNCIEAPQGPISASRQIPADHP
ncbi:MAG TPA: PsiF family protein [Steroidobacteraceae bacterium]|jgi:hypothetical protein